MSTDTKWLGWLALIAPLHMGEQLLFGLDELAQVRSILAGYYGWFADADFATVTLVAVIGTLIYLLAYLIARGGTARRVALGVFGVTGVVEAHHWLDSALAGHYLPGSITAIPYVIFGALLLRCVIRGPQLHEGGSSLAAAAG
jgi:hypothetical protein